MKRFGSFYARLALLLALAVLASHALALSLLFEWLGPPPLPSSAFATLHPSLPPGPPLAGRLVDIGVRVGMLLLAGWIAAEWLSRPMRRLAAAARELGRDIRRAPLVEMGPAECRAVVREFNQLQACVLRQLDDRDRFLGAVSHDLRTPLTRMRLRAEALGDEQRTAAFCQDIAEMEDMIASTLDYLRGQDAAEPAVELELQSLLASIHDDRPQAGARLRLLAPGPVPPYRCQPYAMRRCIGNLVDNALRYGGNAEMSLELMPGGQRIVVRDHGPGLPEAELDKVTQPFYRFESSRNRRLGGVGLGLSIAVDIARQQGGRLVLRNASGGGLAATVELPTKLAE